MSDNRFIAIDWGTTNRRVYLIGPGGAVERTDRDERGVLATPAHEFAQDVARFRERLGDHLVICAGMVGSPRGWVPAPYLECPADLEALARELVWVEPGRSAIVPGLSSVEGGKGDTMRGEEVQLLGAVRAGLVPADSILCQPGTHCKWARMRSGGVVSFRTTMTGEIFAILRRHSLLGDVIEGEVKLDAAFEEGLRDAQGQYLLGDLFGIRASGMLGLRTKSEAASYTSGLLIGSDVREQDLAKGDDVYILADEQFGSLYRAALEARGVNCTIVDSHAAFVAGMVRIRELVDDC